MEFKQILKGGIVTLGSKLTVVITGLGINYFIAKKIGADTLGILSFLTNFVSILSLLGCVGFNILVLKIIPFHLNKVSVRSAQDVFKKCLTIAFFASVLLALILILSSSYLSVNVFNKPYLQDYFYCVAIMFIPNVLFEISSSFLRSVKWVNEIAGTHTAVHIIKFVVVVVMCSFYLKSSFLILVVLLFYLINYIPASWLVNRFFYLNEDKNSHRSNISYKELFMDSLPLMITSTATTLITYTDILMLGAYVEESQIGIYSICAKLAQVTVFILYSVNSVSASGFATLYQEGKLEQLQSIVKKSTRLILLLSLPVFLIYCLFGNQILQLFGQEYVIGYFPLILLVSGKFFSSACGSVGNFLNMTDNKIVYRNIIISGAIINVILNYFLIPEYGITGAAMASMITVVFNNLLPLIYIKYKFGFWTI